MDSFQKTIASRKFILTAIWMAMVVVPFILLFALNTISFSPPSPENKVIPVWIWCLVGLVAAAGSVLWPSLVLSRPRIERILTESEVSLRERLRAISPAWNAPNLPLSELRASYLAALYQVSVVVRLVFAEFISVIGFVHGTQVRSVSAFLPFMVATLILDLLAFPKPGEFLAETQRLSR